MTSGEETERPRHQKTDPDCVMVMSLKVGTTTLAGRFVRMWRSRRLATSHAIVAVWTAVIGTVDAISSSVARNR